MLKRCNRREVWLLVFSTGLILLLVNPPETVVEKYHDWKEAKFLKEAQTAAEVGDWDLAKTKAELGLRWAPGSLPLRKIVVEAVAKEGRAIDSVLLAEQFFNPASTLEERIHMMEVALDGDDQVAFSRFFNYLPEKDKKAPAVIVQRMRLSLQLGRYEEVEMLFESLPSDVRPPIVRLSLVTARVMGAANRKDWGDAINEINSTLGNGQIGADIGWSIFRLIAAIPATELDSERLGNATAWLSENADDALVVDQLIGVSIEMAKLDEAERGVYRKNTIDRFAESSPAELAGWLVQLGFADEALQLPALSELRAAEELEAYDARLDALVAAERWDDALDWLKQPPAGSHKVMLWLSRAKIADKLGDRSLRRQSLTRAIDEAEVVSSENRFFAIYEVAVGLEEMDMASSAAIHGINVKSTILPPSAYFMPVLRYLWEQDRLKEFRGLNLALLRNQPADLDRSNDELYVSLLVDAQPKLDQMVEIGRRLIKEEPENVSFHTTLAWALLRLNQPAEAKRVLDESGVDWENVGLADKLVLANVLAANGDVTKAGQIVQSIGVTTELTQVEIEKLLRPLQP